MAISKLTPPGPAGALRLTVNVALLVPALPSLSETSLIVKLGRSSLSIVPVALAGVPMV